MDRASVKNMDILHRTIEPEEQHTYACPIVMYAMGTQAQRSNPLLSLTERERQVLRLLADGLSAKEIADCLAITPSTATQHICRIYDKLGVHNAVTAVRLAIRTGFIEP